jgi:hypothetical protein
VKVGGNSRPPWRLRRSAAKAASQKTREPVMPTKKTTESKSASARSRAPAKSSAAKSSSSKTASKASASKGEETRKAAPARAASARSTASNSAARKPAAKSASAKSAAPRTARAPKGQERVKGFDGKMTNQPMALAFLMNQHREAEQMFQAYERASSDEEKAELSRQICIALKVHTQIEEELLYPDAHEKMKDEDLVDEAMVEHQSAKDLIAQIESMHVGEHLYDAKVKVLGEYVKHHVREEESEMFPELRKTDMDLEALGPRLQARAEELKGQMSQQSEGGRQSRGLFGGLFGGPEQRA